MRYGIALGSNLGDRLAHMQRGIAELLQRLPGSFVTAAAQVYETDPVDCPPGSQSFYNSVIDLSAPQLPQDVHRVMQEVEQLLGRPLVRDHHAPRPLDLDMLYAGNSMIEQTALQVPHPRLHQRRFVLRPLADIHRDLVLPRQTYSIAELLAALPDDPASVRLVEGAMLCDASSVLTSLNDLHARKLHGPPLAVLTAYDYPTARLLDDSGVDLLLVGDSLGMVVLGLPDTTGVTMDMMLHHVRAVARANPRAPIIADLPAHAYDTPGQAVHNAHLLIQAGAQAVKLEGGVAMIAQVQAIIDDGIPFVGHIGMLPQSVIEEGGYKKKGKTPEGAAALLQDALALDAAGACACVLESMVPEVAAEITRQVKMNTIGIGAGPNCDGQVLVTPDLIGSFPWFRPPFAKARADVAGEMLRAVREYVAEIRSH
jgi:3-methyl-2-oxobutanoate hydroxymethyltransferase